MGYGKASNARYVGTPVNFRQISNMQSQDMCSVCTVFVFVGSPDIVRHGKGADTRTLSAEIFENWGNFLIVEDNAPLFSEENLFLVEMFDETFNIWHVYSL